MNNFYEDDYVLTPEDYGWIHQDDIPDLDSLKTAFKGVLNDLYTLGNPNDLEGKLHQICHLLDIELPSGRPFLKPNRTVFTEMLFKTGVELAIAQHQ